MNNPSSTLNPILKAIGLAMSVAVIVLTILDAVPIEANIMMLGIGLFATSVEAIRCR